MALQLGRFANTYGIKFKNITWLFLEDKDGKVGFDIKKDYQDDFIKGNNTLVLGNSNDYLEIKLFYLFKGFMAKVLGRYLFIMNAQEREKYPDDFITMDKEKGITTLKLKGYDHNLKEIGEFNITYDERNYQIRLSIEKLEKESGYAIIPAGEYTKDYQEMLSEMALLDDSFKETKKEDLKEDPRKMEDASSLKVKVMDKKANYLFDAAVLRKDSKEVQIMVDNIRDSRRKSI